MDQNSLVPLKENLTNLVDWLEDVNTNINEFEIFDTSIEDWTEILSKSSKVIGGIAKIYNISEKIIFKRFLKGLSSKINNQNIIDYKSKQKLDDYLSKQQNVEFVYTTIRKSLTANSLKCTELLAIIVGEILQKQLDMTQENITIIDALHSLNDYDLNNFYKIYKTITENNFRRIRLDKLYEMISKDSIQISIYKLVNLQIFLQNTITTHQGMRWGDENEDLLNTIMKDSEKFLSLYDISDKLFELLDKSKGELLFLV